jgi:RNA polymerase sigma factor (sigma-70 family)
MEDRELLRQFVEQNSQVAFSEVVRRHTDWLYAVCCRRIGDASLAEDAIQAVFLALARKAPSLTNQTTLSPWLYQAAKFAANNMRRGVIRRARHESKAAAMEPIETPPDSPNKWQRLEGAIEPLLDRLKARDRQAILLRFYEQKTGAEIAAQLGISEEAVQKRVSRALERVREMWADSGGGVSSAGIGELLLSHAVRRAPASLTTKLSCLSMPNMAPHLAPIVKGIVLMNAKTITSAIALAVLILAVVTTALIAVRSQTPSSPIMQGQAEKTVPALLAGADDPLRPIILTISATIDGADVLNITPAGTEWTHKVWNWPGRVVINGANFDPHARTTLDQIGLAGADLSSAEVTDSSGRGVVAMERTDTGIAIHFSDPQAGSAPYSIRITFAHSSAAPTTLPTTSPTTLQSAGSIFMDVKATIDGSDMLIVTSQGAQWRHVNTTWPSSVTINDMPWDVQAQPTLDNIGLTKADLSSAEIVTHNGRDTAVMEKTNAGIVVYFSDAIGGGSQYEMKIRFSPTK